MPSRELSDIKRFSYRANLLLASDAWGKLLNVLCFDSFAGNGYLIHCLFLFQQILSY